MKISARNKLQGKVSAIEKGSVNAVVKIDIGGGNNVSATISMDALTDLGIKNGDTAYAIIKSTSVMVGID